RSAPQVQWPSRKGQWLDPPGAQGQNFRIQSKNTVQSGSKNYPEWSGGSAHREAGLPVIRHSSWCTVLKQSCHRTYLLVLHASKTMTKTKLNQLDALTST